MKIEIWGVLIVIVDFGLNVEISYLEVVYCSMVEEGGEVSV